MPHLVAARASSPPDATQPLAVYAEERGRRGPQSTEWAYGKSGLGATSIHPSRPRLRTASAISSSLNGGLRRAFHS